MYGDLIVSKQQSINNNVKNNWDVIVIGAGPSGSMAAAYLGEHGHKTLLIDKDKFPREKICGDGLSHDSVRFLSKIGLIETVKVHAFEAPSAIVYSSSGIKLEIPGPYYSLKRSTFDTVLSNYAIGKGASFYQARVIAINELNDKTFLVDIGENNVKLNTKFVILATGAQNIKLLKSLNLLNRTNPSAVSARLYINSKEKINHFIGSYDKSVLPGYGWIFPMGNEIYNVGVIAFYSNGRKKGDDIKKRFDNFLIKFPLAKNMMKSGKIISTLKGSPLRCGLPSYIIPGKGNLIMTGETIGATFNFTGEGIGKALETGQLAGETIHECIESGNEDTASKYLEKLNLNFRHKYIGYLTAQKWLSNAWLNDYMAKRVRNSSFLMNATIDIIVNETDPRKVFSLKGILNSFWR